MQTVPFPQSTRKSLAIWTLAMVAPLAAPVGATPRGCPIMDKTWQAILTVESHCGQDPRCWIESPDGSLGPAQMRRCRVDDVNRILGRRAYTYQDRLDGTRCREMFDVSVNHYWPRGTPEQWARHWNGSPTRGPYQRATAAYWVKIQRAMLAQAVQTARAASVVRQAASVPPTLRGRLRIPAGDR